MARRRFVTFVLFAMPAASLSQVPIAPPIPNGPPLADVPALPSVRPAWLDEDVRLAGGVVPGSPTWLDGSSTPGLGTHESACTFGGPNPIFQAGTTSTQVLVGAYFSGRPGPSIPSFDYVPVTLRQGWILSGPGDAGMLAGGSWEVLGSLTGATVATNYGTWLAGASLHLRYNFVDPGLPVVPYHQAGVGILFNDAYHDMTQRALGQSCEYHLQYVVGLKYFVSPNLSFDVEGGFNHISNANQADRNYGVNAWGAQVGFTYYFPWGDQ